METRLLRALVELHRRGTMRAVAEATGYGTSAVSAQLAALERDLGVDRFGDDGGALRFICASPLVLAIPTSRTAPGLIDSTQQFASVADLPWVVNSRGDDDGELVERVCAAAGVTPAIAHKVDSLQLILDFVAADLGIALVPASLTAREGVSFVPLSTDGPRRRMYAATRPGRQDWPASALVTQRVAAHALGIA